MPSKTYKKSYLYSVGNNDQNFENKNFYPHEEINQEFSKLTITGTDVNEETKETELTVEPRIYSSVSTQNGYIPFTFKQ